MNIREVVGLILLVMGVILFHLDIGFTTYGTFGTLWQ